MIQAPSLRTDEFFTISVKHLPTSEEVSFEGWVTEFSDQFSSNWNQTSVYGRMDPLATFENTQRTISLGFDIVSDNVDMASRNLANINYLIEFLYPEYISDQRSIQNTLKAAPLLGIKWTNLISNSSAPGYLYGYINGGFNYAPDIGEGGFIKRNTSITSEERETDDVGPVGTLTTVDTTRKSSFIPKKVSISFTFNVLHTHLTGWNNDEAQFSTGMKGSFPNAVYINTKTTVMTDSRTDPELEIGPSSPQFLVNEALILEDS